MVVVDVCGDLTLLSAGPSLIIYNHSTSKARVINVFTENNNNNSTSGSSSGKTDEEEEEKEEHKGGGGGGGGDDDKEVNGRKKKKGDKEERNDAQGDKGRKKENGKTDKEEKKRKNTSGVDNQSIAAAKFSPCGRWVVVGGGWKAVQVWSVAEWVRKASHTLPKRPTALAVTADSTCVYVADRAGDVYKLPMPSTASSTSSTPHKPVLGHLSMLLDIAITPEGRYIVTCDRDEKVRLTHLTHTSLIHTFLLGHLEFVTCLAVLSAAPPRLLSCSGDGTIKLWDYETGACLCTLDLAPHVTPLPPLLPGLSVEERTEEMEREGRSISPTTATATTTTTTTPAVKKLAVISSSSSSSSSSSYLVAAFVYRAKEVVLCKVEDTHLHLISTTPLKGEPLGGAWRRRRKKETSGGGEGEELILVVEDTSGGGGGSVVVMEVVENKLVEVKEEEKKEEEEEEEALASVGRRYQHLLKGSSSSGGGLAFLYKQKYDNVEEYMRKKRERIKMEQEGHTLTKRGRWVK